MFLIRALPRMAKRRDGGRGPCPVAGGKRPCAELERCPRMDKCPCSQGWREGTLWKRV